MILCIYDATENDVTIITKMLGNDIAVSANDTYFKNLF